jgi:hypothetical protein
MRYFKIGPTTNPRAMWRCCLRWADPRVRH